MSLINQPVYVFLKWIFCTFIITCASHHHEHEYEFVNFLYFEKVSCYYEHAWAFVSCSSVRICKYIYCTERVSLQYESPDVFISNMPLCAYMLRCNVFFFPGFTFISISSCAVFESSELLSSKRSFNHNRTFTAEVV